MHIFQITVFLSLSIVYSKCGHKCEKMFKEEESVALLKNTGLINNTEEYKKIYNHVLKK